MARTKQPSKRNRQKIALPVWGAAGMSLAMATGASAAAPTPDTSAKHNALLSAITLGEEELTDVNLSTFFVYDREATAASRVGEQYAQRCGRGCGGCAARGCAARCGGGCAARGCRCGGGCGGCAVVRRCGVGIGCAVVRCLGGCAGCSCSCCLSWGSCQIC